MADITEKNVQMTGNITKATFNTVSKILAELAQYLENRSKFASQRAFAEWIKKNGSICAYPIQGNCAAQFKYQLEKEQLPYLELADSQKILIRTPDLEKVKNINREILISKCNYFQDVDSREMENAINKFDAIKNKDIFTIHNLTKYDVEAIKNKCNRICAGFMVGILKEDEANERYSLSIHADKLFDNSVAENENSLAKEDFSKAYFKAMISLYGANGYLKHEQIDADEKIDIAIEQMTGSDEVHYIIGIDDSRKFIEINSNGFEYYNTSVDNEGRRIDKQIARCDSSDPNYYSELQRYTDKIFNKAILNSSEELSEHLKTQKRNMTSNRPEKTRAQYDVSIGEDCLCDDIDVMIKTHITDKNLYFSNPKDSFEYYQKEAIKIFDAVIHNKELSQYPADKMEALRTIAREHNLPANEYENVLKLKPAKSEVHKAQSLREEVIKKVRDDYGYANR